MSDKKMGMKNKNMTIIHPCARVGERADVAGRERGSNVGDQQQWHGAHHEVDCKCATELS